VHHDVGVGGIELVRRRQWRRVEAEPPRLHC
jgi:hypothetical protein